MSWCLLNTLGSHAPLPNQDQAWSVMWLTFNVLCSQSARWSAQWYAPKQLCTCDWLQICMHMLAKQLVQMHFCHGLFTARPCTISTSTCLNAVLAPALMIIHCIVLACNACNLHFLSGLQSMTAYCWYTLCVVAVQNLILWLQIRRSLRSRSLPTKFAGSASQGPANLQIQCCHLISLEQQLCYVSLWADGT